MMRRVESMISMPSELNSSKVRSSFSDFFRARAEAGFSLMGMSIRLGH